MTWTQDMLAAVKGNDRPHGLAQRDVREWIEQAHKEGAPIECYDGQWELREDPVWANAWAYRVAASWTPPKPEPPKPRYETVRSQTRMSLGECGYLDDSGNWWDIDFAARKSNFIAYEYADGGMSSEYRRVSRIIGLPAEIPVAVLFCREVGV